MYAYRITKSIRGIDFSFHFITQKIYLRNIPVLGELLHGLEAVFVQQNEQLLMQTLGEFPKMCL